LFVHANAQIGLMRWNTDAACFSLEDVPRAVKVPGETCIPAGLYQLKLRTFGRMFELYRTRYPWNDSGMIEVTHVPGFTDILIHCGNTEKDTRGCILVAESVHCNRGDASLSLDAYRRVYGAITSELRNQRNVYLEVLDIREQEGEEHGS
jgi:hypothetical protein